MEIQTLIKISYSSEKNIRFFSSLPRFGVLCVKKIKSKFWPGKVSHSPNSVFIVILLSVHAVSGNTGMSSFSFA